MTHAFEAQLFAIFLMFCRLGGCMLFAPGLSSPRVPVHVRLFAALGMTAAVAPLLLPDFLGGIVGVSEDRRIWLVLSEASFGAFIGLLARCFFLALQFAATAVANFIGLSGIPGIPLEEGDTGSPLATLASSAAVTVIFAMGLHVELLRAVIDSYAVLRPGNFLGAGPIRANFLRTLSESWLLGLRLAAPFLLYGVIVNFALGLGNRFAQQISVYHATTGAVMLGGFLLFYLMWTDWMIVFIDVYKTWLLEGGF